MDSPKLDYGYEFRMCLDQAVNIYLFNKAFKNGFSFVKIGWFQMKFPKLDYGYELRLCWDQAANILCSSLFVQIGLLLSQNWICQKRFFN